MKKQEHPPTDRGYSSFVDTFKPKILHQPWNLNKEGFA